MEEGLAQRSQGFLLLLLLLKCSGICCFSSGFVACGLLGTPGDLSVYLLFILMAPWERPHRQEVEEAAPRSHGTPRPHASPHRSRWPFFLPR